MLMTRKTRFPVIHHPPSPVSMWIVVPPRKNIHVCAGLEVKPRDILKTDFVKPESPHAHTRLLYV